MRDAWLSTRPESVEKDSIIPVLNTLCALEAQTMSMIHASVTCEFYGLDTQGLVQDISFFIIITLILKHTYMCS